jgi:6-phosphogluconolactonase
MEDAVSTRYRFVASGWNDALVHGILDSEAGIVEVGDPVPSPLRMSYVDYHAPSGLVLGLWIPEHDDTDGALMAYDLARPAAGPVFQLSTQARGPCHFFVHEAAGIIPVACYSGGALTVFRWDGKRETTPELVECLRFTGGSVHPKRQTQPRAHGVAWTPDGRWLYLCDLGTDRVSWFPLSRWTGAPAPGDPPAGFVNSTPGAGPRHCAVAPDGAHLYMVNEMSMTICSYAIEAETGSLSLVEEQTTVIGADGAAAEAPAESTAAEVAVHPSGRWVYVSNRGPHTVAVFERDAASGSLAPRGSFSTEGEWPRHFSVDAAGTVMLVANVRSNSVSAFALDAETGLGRPIGEPIAVPRPTCAQIMEG